ncbi:MAG TPA: 2-dehydropantoate 2-reductase [Verrucomicrobiae bacterium]|jgi:2-dehydropantoate 2-reductase|nr:2-dehydropantoate 2-reductase [Verrucomicrobiae bacterium]
MKRIAVIGPGAIGGTVIVRLAQAKDHSIVVCARSPVPQFTLEAPDGKMTATPEVLTSPNQARTVDWIMVATKTYDAPAAASWFQPLMGPETHLAVLQNGVEHIKRFAPYFPESRIVPVVVDMPVEREAPGFFRQRGPGRCTVPANSSGEEFARLFDKTGIEVVLVSDFQTALWHKLAINCAGAVSALVLKPASITHRPQIADIIRGLVRECVAVGIAEGASLDDSLVDWVLDRYQKAPPDSINSLHADRIAGRPMEIDTRNGVIVRLGSKHGIPAPVNQMIVALLKAAE